MAEFLDTGMRVFRFLRLCHGIGFHRLTCDGIFSIAAFAAFLRLRIVIRYRFLRLRNFLRSFKILRFVVRSIRNIVDFQHFIDGVIAGFRNILVDDGDFQSRHQEASLPDTVDQLLVAEFCGIVENLRISPVTDAGTGDLRTDLANDLKFGRAVLARALERRIRRRMLRIDVGIHTRVTLMERHVMGFAITIHFHIKPGAQRVHHGRAHTMQAARGAVRRVAELRAGMQLGQHHFHAGKLSLRLNVDRDTSSVVGNFHGTVGMQRHNNMVTDTSKGLIDGIIDDLP